MLVKPLWLAFMVAAAPRWLGVEEYGVMQSSLALAGLALAFSDLGTTNYSLREATREGTEQQRLLANVLTVRGLTLLVSGGIGLAVSYWLDYPLGVVVAALAYVAAQHITTFGRVFFRAAENLRHEAVSTVLERLLVVGFGGLLLLWAGTASGTLAAMAMAMGLVAVAQLVWIGRRHVPFRPDLLDSRYAWRTLRLALPLGAADVLLAVYFRTDQVMVEAMLGDAAAGLYGQAFRLLEALSLIPTIVVQGVLFARLSRLEAESRVDEFRRVMRNGSLALAAVGIAVAATLWFGAEPLIRLLTGGDEFAASADALRVLVWTFPFTCLKDLLFVSFIARRLHRVPILVFGASAVANVSFNALAIPAFGIAGAAAVTVCTEVAIVVAYLVYSRTLRSRP